jgi:hypothetical protein
MQPSTKKSFLFILAACIMLAACADVSNVDSCVTAEPYGFWSGLWHGWISGFAFIGSLFSDDIAIYAVNNTGGWYDFGFVLGAGTLGVTVGRSSKR